MKKYTNTKSRLTIVSGKIKEFSEDRTLMTLITSEYDKAEKAVKEVEAQVMGRIPYDMDTYKEGFHVTAVGYESNRPPHIIEAEGPVLIGQAMWENTDLTVINGFVNKAVYVSEKDEAGNPRLTQSGVPRKPHYDITVQVKDEQGNYVNHVVRTYDNPKDNTSAIERMQKLFKNFDREENPAVVSIVTRPGETRVSTFQKDGKERRSYWCTHMNVYSLDLEYTKDREKEKASQPKAQDQDQASPMQSAPNGFDVPQIDMEDVSEFR